MRAVEKLKQQFLQLNDAWVRNTAETWWKQGRLLIKMKEQVPHGKWIPWVEKNLKVTRRHADRLMQIGGLPKLPGKWDAQSPFEDSEPIQADLVAIASMVKREGGDVDEVAEKFYAQQAAADEELQRLLHRKVRDLDNPDARSDDNEGLEVRPKGGREHVPFNKHAANVLYAEEERQARDVIEATWLTSWPIQSGHFRARYVKTSEAKRADDAILLQPFAAGNNPNDPLARKRIFVQLVRGVTIEIEFRKGIPERQLHVDEALRKNGHDVQPASAIVGKSLGIDPDRG